MDVVSGLNFSLCLPGGIFFVCFYYILLIFKFILKPLLLLVCDRRCLLLTVTLGWLVKILAWHCYVTVGRAWGDYSSSSLWLRAASSGGCCGFGLGFFILLLVLKKVKYMEKWSISIGDDFISHSFCFPFLNCLSFI